MTITTRKWNPSVGHPARIRVECLKKSATRYWDVNLTEEQNHAKAAQHLAFSLGCCGATMTSGKQREGVMVHIFNKKGTK